MTQYQQPDQFILLPGGDMSDCHIWLITVSTFIQSLPASFSAWRPDINNKKEALSI